MRRLVTAAVAGLLAVGVTVYDLPAEAVTAAPCSFEFQGYCIDATNDNLSAPKGFQASVPKPLTITSTEASAGLATTTTQTGAITNVMKSGALADAGTAGQVGVAADSTPGLGQIIGAGFMGYTVGNLGVQVACANGVSLLCRPSPASTYVPNTDAVSAGDPGWKNGASVVNMYATASTTVTVTLAPLLPVPSVGDDLVHDGVHFKASGTQGGTMSYADCNNSAAADYTMCPGGTQGGVFVSPSYGNEFTIRGMPSTDATVANSVPCKVFFYNASNGALGGPAGGDPSAKPDAEYDFPGCAARGQAVSPNPQRQWQTTLTCKLVSDGSTTTVSLSSAPFQETDSSLPAFPEPSCPAGSVLAGVQIVETTPGLPDKTIWGPVTIPAPIVNQRIAHPECLDHTCLLGLYKLDTAGQLNSCFVASTDCAGWLTDPTRSADYRCTYGPQGTSADPVVDISECYVYGPTFDPQKQAGGVPYGDPRDGSSPATLVPAPGTQPGGGSSSSTSGSCFPSGWGSFNPLQWIVQPLKCLFIPDPAELQTAWQQARDLLVSKPPFSVIAAFVPVLTGLIGAVGSDCSGSLADFGDGLAVPCAPPGDPAWFQALYFIAEVGIVAGTAFILWRMIEGSLHK